MLVSVMPSYEKHWVMGRCLSNCCTLLIQLLTCRAVDVQSLLTQRYKWLLSNTV